MKIERTELQNEIYFTTIPTDKFKTEQLTLYLTVPLTNEADASRIALLPRVLRRGSSAYPTAAALVRRQEELYSADLSSGTIKIGESQVLVLTVDVLRRDFVPKGEDLLLPATELLLGLLFSPCIDKTTGVFLDDYVEGEKTNACHAIRSLQNNKAVYALNRCISHMCEGEPYAIHEWGSEEEIERITPASLYDAYRRLLTEARFEIFYCGTADTEGLIARIREAFAGVTRHPLPVRTAERQIVPERKKHVTERASVLQGKLCLGFRTGVTLSDADAAAFMLFHAIYSQSPTSKLFVNVRERLSLCYSCGSRAEMAAGLLFVSAGIDNKNRRRAVREILRQLRRMRAGKITANEMDMALRMLKNQLASLEDEPAVLRRFYLVRALRGVLQTPDELAAALDGVTVRDLARVAKRVLPDTVYFLRGSQEGGEETEDE